MIRSIDEDDEIENILRSKEYKKEIYIINEKIKQNNNIKKLYGYNKERNLNVIITKILNISFEENPNFEKRLLIIIKLIEENKLLVENLWIERTVNNNYNLYISELTNSIYRNEYNLITLNNYMNSAQNTYKENIEILISIIEKMIYFQNINFSHLNINPNNIYINIKNNNIYFGPPKLVKNYSNDYTYLWYSSPEENYIEDEIWENNMLSSYSDIWSLGCIICEMFFINFPLFQSYSANDKIFKIIEILGFPEYKDVDYMDIYQYNSLIKKSNNKSKKNNLIGFLLSTEKESMSPLYNFKIELIDIINGCFSYNRKNRMPLEEMLKKLKYLNGNISTEFQSIVSYSINTEESDTSNYLSSNISNNINDINTNTKNVDISKPINLNDNINNIFKFKNMEEPISNYSLETKEENSNNINIGNGNNIIDSIYNQNISNIDNGKINFYPLDIQNINTHNYMDKNQKDLVINSDNIDKRVKKILEDYENSKNKYENFSENENNKKDNIILKELNNNKIINNRNIKDIGGIEEKDEYKELYISKLFFINYYFLFL